LGKRERGGIGVVAAFNDLEVGGYGA
jgi:hypothetical protein